MNKGHSFYVVELSGRIIHKCPVVYATNEQCIEAAKLAAKLFGGSRIVYTTIDAEGNQAPLPMK